MSNNRPLRLLLAVLAAVALLAAACGDDDDSASSDTTAPAEDTADTAETGDEEMADATTTTAAAAGFEGDLVGVFGVTAGMCDDAGMPSGTYFQMTQADGTSVPNADSACADQAYTLMTAGTDGGLMTGDYQPAPDPAFDDAGGALAAAITEPVKFFGLAFGAATEAVQVQEDGDVETPAPAITATDGTLSGDLSAMTAYYGGAAFNQGAPKPAGDEPGPTGTIDPETGDYVLEWSSQIVGGSFDTFIGVWHLEGTFAES
jgi:hypothetical protein